MIDADSLDAGQNFDDLPETYVIFITENDVIGKGLPIYHIERQIIETGEAYDDGEHIIYVNGANEDSGTELGKLMHDFRCTKPDDMFFDELAERPRYFKETDEGVNTMCKVIEDMRSEVAKAHADGQLSGRRGGIVDVEDFAAHADERATYYVAHHRAGDAAIAADNDFHGAVVGGFLGYEGGVCGGELHDIQRIQRIAGAPADSAADAGNGFD